MTFFTFPYLVTHTKSFWTSDPNDIQGWIDLLVTAPKGTVFPLLVKLSLLSHKTKVKVCPLWQRTISVLKTSEQAYFIHHLLAPEAQPADHTVEVGKLDVSQPWGIPSPAYPCPRFFLSHWGSLQSAQVPGPHVSRGAIIPCPSKATAELATKD